MAESLTGSCMRSIRTAILLLGGKKGGDDRWYKKVVRRADRLYDEHLAQIEKEGRTDG